MLFKLIINPRTGSTGRTEVLIECYHDRRYRTIGTGIHTVPKFWDKAKHIVTNKHPQAATVNNLLKSKLHELEQRAYKYEETPGNTFDFEQLKAVTKGKDKQSFCDFITDQLKKEKLELKSYIKYKGNIEQLREILGDLPIEQFTEKHIEKLNNHFRTKYADSTIARMNIFVQKYLKKGIKLRIITYNPYDRVELPKFHKELKNVFHTMAELEALEAIENLNYPIDMIRDRYLYSCYTGLRISDNLALLKSSLIDTPDGYVCELRTIKGYGSDLIHPLGLMFDGKPDIIARRWMAKHAGPTVFPVISDEYIRASLNVLASMCKPPITKHITFHVARHTCASLLADISQNPYLIKNVLGHKDINTSMSYIHASPEATKKQFRLLTNWKEKAR